MATVIENMGARLTLDLENYRWRSVVKAAEALFNLLLSPLGPGGQDPDPPATAAREAVKRIKGTKIIELDPPEPYIDGVTY